MIRESSIFCSRSHGQCGLDPKLSINVDVFKSGKAVLMFFPASEDADTEFTVTHNSAQKGTPRFTFDSREGCQKSLLMKPLLLHFRSFK